MHRDWSASLESREVTGASPYAVKGSMRDGVRDDPKRHADELCSGPAACLNLALMG